MAEGTLMKQLQTRLDALEIGLRQNQEQVDERLEMVEVGIHHTQAEVNRGRANMSMIERNLRENFSHLREEFSSLSQ